VQYKKPVYWILILVVTSLTSCNLGRAPAPTADESGYYTAAALTVVAQLQMTQTAAAVAQTDTPAPTEMSTVPPAPTEAIGTGVTPFTASTPFVAVTSAASAAAPPVAGSSNTAVGCADAAFVADMTIPDGTTEKPGAAFRKVWRLQNTGTCNWDGGFVFAFVYGSKMGGYDVHITDKTHIVTPGSTADFGVNLIAPAVPNTYTGCWKMETDAGYFFGQAVCVTIKVSR
jgi:hypothetical protein